MHTKNFYIFLSPLHIYLHIYLYIYMLYYTAKYSKYHTYLTHKAHNNKLTLFYTHIYCTHIYPCMTRYS